MNKSPDEPRGPLGKFTHILYTVYAAVAGWGFFCNALKALWDAGSSGWQFLSSKGFAALALLVWGALLGPWGLIAAIGVVCGLASAVGLFAAVIYLIREGLRLQKASGEYGLPSLLPSKVLRTCRNLIVGIYDQRSFSHLHTVQILLRSLVVLFVCASATWSLSGRSDSSTANAMQLVMAMNAVHICASVFYSAAIATHFFNGRRQLLSLEQAGNQYNEGDPYAIVARCFWSGARIDLIFVSLVWITTLLPNRPFHLAYILPMMGTWLFEGERALRTFVLVITGLLGRFTMVAMVAQFGTATASSLGYHGNYGILLLLWALLPELAFWLTLGILLAILRHLRWKAKAKAITLDNALAKESLLRRAFEILSANQGDVVFAKDILRRFIFANEVLLDRFAKIEEARGNKHADRASVWAAMDGKTDKELRIDRDIYERSDQGVLRSQGGASDHYADFEPAFDPSAPQGSTIWTRKEAIRNTDGEVIGLVGCVVDGLPVQMQKMCTYLTSKLPIYASMKDADGYIVWANDRHLERMRPAITRLIKDQQIILEDGADLRARFKAINNGRGPKDVDLYEESVGTKYRTRDLELMQCAENCAGDPANFEARLTTIIREWFPESKHRSYPEDGWMEYHKFPDADRPVWVQVWKMPWWEESAGRPSAVPKLKGLLVFFQDHHRSYMKESVVWRWLRGHLYRAEESSKELLNSSIKSPIDSPGSVAMSYLELSSLMRSLLLWFETSVEERDNEAQVPTQRRDLKDLEALLVVLEQCWRGKVPIQKDFGDVALSFERGGDWLFGSIVCLLMNAIESTINGQRDAWNLSAVRLQIRKDSANTLVATIEDNGCSLSNDACKRIFELGSPSSKGGAPGGGVYLAKYLTMRILKLMPAPATGGPSEAVALQPNPQGLGMIATIRVPMEAFQLRQPRI